MIKALLNYQEKDAKLRDIEKTLASSEERKKAMTAKKYLEGVEDSVNKLDIRSAELVAEYEKATNEQLKLKEQQVAINDAIKGMEAEEEASYLLKKVEELIGKIKSLGAKANKILEELQAVLKEYSTVKATTKNAQVQYKENIDKYNQLKDSVKGEKESVERELEKLSKEVPKDLMERYQQKRNAKIYPVLFKARGNVCGACNMELSMSVQSKLKNGEVIDCDNCGRLIYQE